MYWIQRSEETTNTSWINWATVFINRIRDFLTSGWGDKLRNHPERADVPRSTDCGHCSECIETKEVPDFFTIPVET